MPTTKKARKRVLGIALYLVYLVIAVAALLGCAELAMTALGYPVLAPSDYPDDPANYVKIAIFGESSSQGANAGRKFEDVLRIELARRYPGVRTYIHNYGRPGYLFHNYEAKILKGNIQRYDIFLIYAGHGEVHGPLDETGYWRRPEFRKYRQFQIYPGADATPTQRFLDHRSRIYAYFYARQYQRVATLEQKVGGFQREIQFSEFEPRAVITPDERRRVESDWKADLEDIAGLAARYGKRVVISGVPSNETWQPFFSVLPESLDAGSRHAFLDSYHEGKARFDRGSYAAALEELRKAYAIAPRAAIVTWLIGLCHEKLGRRDEARKFLRSAMDDDGFPARAWYAHFTNAEAVARASTSMRFVDTISVFHRLVDEKGLTYDDLFADFQHPSVLGHVIIGLELMCALDELEPFRGNKRDACIDPLRSDPKELYARFLRALQFTDADLSGVSLGNAQWFYSMTHFSAYPKLYLDLAEKNARLYFEKSRKTPRDEGNLNWLLNMIDRRRAQRLGPS